MNLSKKVLLSVFLSFGLILAAVYYNSQQTIEKSYLRLETEQAIDNMNRIKEAIGLLSQSTDMMLMDWSVWDDPYQFVLDNNQDFKDSNFNIFSAASANIDLFLFFNMKGDLVASYMLNAERIAAIPVPKEISQTFEPGGKFRHLIENPGPKSHVSGLMKFSAEPLFSSGIFFVSANNIVKTSGEGPPHGILVMATRLTDPVLDKIKTNTGLKIDIYRIEDTQQNPALAAIYKELATSKELITETNEDKLYGYTLLRDLNHQPIAIIKMTMNRSIYQTGIETIRYLGIAFITSGIIFSLLLFYLLRILIIKRLEKIARTIRTIGQTGNFALKISEQGGDEISTLADEINKMLSFTVEYSENKKNLLDSVNQKINQVNVFTHQLKDSEALLNDIINSMPSIMIILDKEGIIVDFNDAAEKETGISADEAKGKNILILFPFLKTMYNEFNIADEKQKMQEVMQEQNRTYRVIFYPFLYHSDQYVVVRIDDMTEQVKMHQRLLQDDRLASIGVLTAGVAHEINNPINFLSAAINPLKKNISDILLVLDKYSQITASENLTQQLAEINALKQELNIDYIIEETNQLINGIMEGASRTIETVKNLSLFTRVGEDSLKKSDIHEGIDSTLNLLKHNYKNRILIVKEYGDIPKITYHPGKINQVFMNILANAIDSIPDKGQLTIKTQRVDDQVIISFKDTGAGMNEETMKHIFEPFFTTKGEKGTGLGLSISYSIIKEHKGNIQVKSKLGHGTEFIITLPVK